MPKKQKSGLYRTKIKIGVDAALEEAGCVAGDEVRIAGYSFAYEGAEEYGYEEDLPIEDEEA